MTKGDYMTVWLAIYAELLNPYCSPLFDCNSLQKDYDKYVPKKMIYYSGTGKAQKKKEWKKVTIRSQVS